MCCFVIVFHVCVCVSTADHLSCVCVSIADPLLLPFFHCPRSLLPGQSLTTSPCSSRQGTVAILASLRAAISVRARCPGWIGLFAKSRQL